MKQFNTSVAVAMEAALAGRTNPNRDAFVAAATRALKPFGFRDVAFVTPLRVEAFRPYPFPSGGAAVTNQMARDAFFALGRVHDAIAQGGVEVTAEPKGYRLTLTLTERAAVALEV